MRVVTLHKQFITQKTDKKTSQLFKLFRERSLALGSIKIDRQLNYQGLLDSYLTERQLELIRRTVDNGMVFGNERFIQKWLY